MLTYERVRELFDYDPDTGDLIWKISPKGGVPVGYKAGSANKRGYLCTVVSGVSYRNNRLAWLWYYGYFPEKEVDHINRVKTDNRIKNLREVSHSCNTRNACIRRDNTSGVKGVSWDNLHKKWVCQINSKKRRRHVGYYDDFDEAVCARLAAEQCLNWAGCDSNSTAYQYVRRMLCR